MPIYIGFDDTDFPGADTGTGKLARRFESLIPPPCRVLGVVRQQLLVDPAIPYTSHNSSACVILDDTDPALEDRLLALAIEHLELSALPGSDPGLCFARSDHSRMAALQEFGLKCTRQIVTQGEALRAAASIHLSGHGGTHDGIIGAAAAVGLTASGWCGRFIEYSGLRDFPDPVSVSALAQKGIRVVSLDRDAITPRLEDEVHTRGWLRPRLWGSQAVLPVNPSGPGRWESMGKKRNKEKPKKGGMKMAGKIFYRERLKIGVKEKKPRFKLVAVAGVDITFYGDHLRKKELEEIAEAVGAELVLLKVQKKDKDEEVEVKD